MTPARVIAFVVRERERQRFEPFVHLVDVTDTAALLAWGGFFLRRGADGSVVDDDDLPKSRGPGGTIGVRSAPYGQARVDVLDGAGEVMTSATTRDRNNVWVEGLQPDTEYRYRVTVDGEPWADGERWDWAREPTADRAVHVRAAAATT